MTTLLKLLTLTGAGAFMLPTLGAAAQARTFKLDGGGASHIQFVSDAPLERITGVSAKVSGEITVDPGQVAQAKAQIRVPVTSIKTGNDLRDEHLRGDGWLDAAKFPNAELVLRQVSGLDKLEPNTGAELKVSGVFTIHGVSRELSTKARVRLIPAAPGATTDTLRVQASFVVHLVDHKVSIPSIVSLKVSPNIQVNVDLRATADATAPVLAATAPSTEVAPTPSPAVSAAAPQAPGPGVRKPESAAAGAPPKAGTRPAKPATTPTPAPAGASAAAAPKESAASPTSALPQEPAWYVQRLRVLMREAQNALKDGDVQRAEARVKSAQSLLVRFSRELGAVSAR